MSQKLATRWKYIGSVRSRQFRNNNMLRLERPFLIWFQSEVDTCLISSCYFLDFGEIFKCSNTRVTWGVFANNFLLSLAISPSLIFASHLLQFFFLFTLQTQKAIGYMSGLLFTRKIYSLLMIIFASFQHCALLTLWPISGLPEFMPFPCYLYSKFTLRRESAISIIRVASPEVHGHGQGNRNGNPFCYNCAK